VHAVWSYAGWCARSSLDAKAEETAGGGFSIFEKCSSKITSTQPLTCLIQKNNKIQGQSDVQNDKDTCDWEREMGVEKR
jgi:hypothetical protein